MLSAWKKYLVSNIVPKDGVKPLTHTSYTGGRFNLPMTPEDWKKYEEQAKHEPQHLIERPLEDIHPVIAVDFDFRYNTNITTRQHEDALIYAVCSEIADAIHHTTNNEGGFKYHIAVEQKPMTHLSKTDDGKYRKDGIHIKLGVRASRDTQNILRDKLLLTMPDILGDLPLTNGIEDIIDPAVLGGVNGLTMPLSSKPNDRPYELTHLYSVEYDADGELQSLVQQGDFDDITPAQLSIRNRDLPEVEMDDDCAEVIAFKSRTNHKVVKSRVASVASHAPRDDPPETLMSQINTRTKPENARDYADWWKICVKILKYGRDVLRLSGKECEDGVHYFSRLCPDKYDCGRVNNWLATANADKFNFLAWRDTDLSKDIHLSVLLKGSSSVAEIIANDLNPVLRYDGKNFWRCDSVTHLWKMRDPYRTIVLAIHARIDMSVEKIKRKRGNAEDEDDDGKDKKTQAEYFKQYAKTDNTTYINGVIKHIGDLLYEDDFHAKCNALFGSFAFKNGVLNMETREFRRGILPDDYLTKTIDCDYSPSNPDDLQRVKKVIWDICSHNAEYEAFLYRQLGYAMSGFADKEQFFFFWEGLTASNGKSTIMEALAMTPYVLKLNNETFKQDNAKYHKHIHELKSNPRIAWLNEPAKTKGIKMDEAKLKEFADGGDIKNEVMFGTVETITNHAKLIITDNATLTPANADKGYERRMLMTPFGAKFYNHQDWDALLEQRDANPDTEFLADGNIIGYMKTYPALLALLELILDGYADWLRQGKLNPPMAFQLAKIEAVSSTDTMGEYVRSHFRKCVGKNIGKIFINKHYNSDVNGNIEDKRDFTQSLIKSLKREGYDYQSQKSYRHNGKVCSGMVMDIEYVKLECDDDGEEYYVE